MEEIENRIRPVELDAFREFMTRLTTAESFEKAEAIADEFLPPEQAASLAKFVRTTSAESFSEAYSDKNKDFGTAELHENLRLAYLAVIASVRGDYFSNPLPDDLVNAAALISAGEHLAAAGQKAEALEKFKIAMATTKLYDARRIHFAEFCSTNGFANESSDFWTGPRAVEEK